MTASSAPPRTVWIINPYGSLPTEGWATYRSTMLAERLVEAGFEVTQFISTFEHRSKTFRCDGPAVHRVRDGYTIHLVPGPGYQSHVSLDRIRHERAYARNLLAAAKPLPAPDIIVLAEPALFYYGLLLQPLLATGRSRLVLDVIDIWPELFELVIPARLRWMSPLVLAPFHAWRRRLYARADAVVAVARDYLDLARGLARRPGVRFEVVYWSWDGRARAVGDGGSAAVQRLVSGKTSDEVWAVYAGTLGENYDIASIVAAARTLPRELAGSVRLRFVVAGDGPLKTLCQDSAGEDFVFLGRLAAADLAELYRHCDIALSTYRGESTVSMPIKAFDYLRHGLPIVNSLGRDLGRLIESRGLGLNYDPRVPLSLSEAVRTLATDASFREACAARARAAAPEFEAGVQYGKFVELLRRLEPARRRAQAGASTQ